MEAERSVPVQQDMLIEILIYLPVKSLVRFTCVSKYWCALIKSHTFRTRHLKRDCKVETLLVKRFLPNSNSEKYLLGDIILSFHDPDCPELLVSPNYVPPFCKDTWNTEIDLYGSCNGLVCLICRDVVILSNPALRESKMLAPSSFALPDGYMAINYGSGFGYDADTNDYKIIQMWHITELVAVEHFYDADSCIRIDLYNSSTNSWKIIDALIPRIYNKSGFDLYFNGAFHWASCELIEGPSNMSTILTFDVRNEVFREFKCPYHEEKKPALMVLNTCLALLVYNGIDPVDIWIMKEYGVKESWTKELVIGPYLFKRPLFCWRNECLFVETISYSQLGSCALHANEIKEFQFYGLRGTFRANIFVESLVSLDQLF